MSKEISYTDLNRHGDTLFDRETNTKVQLLHARYVTGSGFFGYARGGFIFILTNMTVDMIDGRFLSESRMILTEKHKPFYADRDIWLFFSENQGNFGFGYEKTTQDLEEKRRKRIRDDEEALRKRRKRMRSFY